MASLQTCCILASSICVLLVSLSSAALPSRTIDVSKHSTELSSGRVTFNRPPGTRPVVVTNTGSSLSDQYGRTFGQYGSYRDHLSWKHAVLIDRQRHSFMHNNQRQPFHWMFRNLNMPLAYGFDLQGFWNSYAPLVQDGTHRPRKLMLSSIEPLKMSDE